jgi:bifunctional oligoribonuclease and PAP phosphatase NrnA
MDNISQLKEKLDTPKKILITTHHKPDADALGSSLALTGFLKKKGHQVTVITPTDYPGFLQWMQFNEEVIVFNEGNEKRSEQLINESDIIFCLDFSALTRINELGEIIRVSKAYKVLIDHHLEPESFADFEFWNPKAAATAELIFELILKMDEMHLMDQKTAECIYAGIMTDTGSFRHSSTSKRVHQIVGELIDMGVDTAKVHRLVYDNNTEERLKFIGYALCNKLHVLKEYNAAYFAITADDLKAFNSRTGDTEGLVNYALSIENTVLAAIIIDRKEAIKLSFRSVGDFSVNEFSRKHFNGGGHNNAAGGVSYLTLDETVKKFLEVLPEYKEQLNKVNFSNNN